mgnify:CR=1 FL=1
MVSTIRWQALLLFIVFLLVLAVGYVASTRSIAFVPQAGGIYTEGIVGAPLYLNPILASYNEVDRDLCYLLFDGLTQSDAHGNIEGNLARWWDVSEDGLIYTFYLRDDARWHDGALVTAKDVLFTIHAIQDPDYRGPAELAAFWRDVAVAQLNTYTVRFTLPQPFAPFASYTTIGILPEHILSGVSAADLPSHSFNLAPVGTGSFRFKEINEDRLILERNPYDYRPQPYLDRLQFVFYPDEDAALAAYREGEIDGVSRVLLDDLTEALQDTSLTLYSAPLCGYTAVFFDTQSPLFADPALRQALLYATDRQQLVDQLLQGQGLVAHSPIPPYSWAYNGDVPHYAYDPAQAARLLDERGWLEQEDAAARNKGSQKLTFTLLTDDNPSHVQVAQELVRQWAAVGIVADVKVMPVATLIRDHLRPRQFDAVLYEIRSLPIDPDPYPFWHSTQAADPGQNLSRLHSAEMDILLEEGRLNGNAQTRKRLYDEFQVRFAQEVPALLLYYPVYHYAISNRVRNVQLAPMVNAAERFRTIRDWYVMTRQVFASEVAATPSPISSTDRP